MSSPIDIKSSCACSGTRCLSGMVCTSLPGKMFTRCTQPPHTGATDTGQQSCIQKASSKTWLQRKGWCQLGLQRKLGGAQPQGTDLSKQHIIIVVIMTRHAQLEATVLQHDQTCKVT
jgi:hypothetical protein